MVDRTAGKGSGGGERVKMLKTYDGDTFLQKYRWRGFNDYPEELSSVREIISEVRRLGDEAVLKFTRRFDGADIKSLEVSEAELAAAESAVSGKLRRALARAAENIRTFHHRQLRECDLCRQDSGVVLGQLHRPLGRVGTYIPGGGASYPSSVLMTVIPAKVAGVKEVILVTPPRPDGSVDPHVLVAAKLTGTSRVFKCGGAQAVAALAYGSRSIPRVDKIVGPGNLYVTLAKKEVAGVVGIDMLAGPSEVLVLADDSAKAHFVAADLLAQAEHDALAAAWCVTTSARLARELPVELDRQCATLKRSKTAGEALHNRGALVLTAGLAEAIVIVNAMAPEHLELHLADPWPVLEKIQNAGAVFVGEYTPEPVGDYWAGPSHVLPTGGAARFSSPLCVDDFIKKISVIHYPSTELSEITGDIEALAAVEGLEAHGRAVKIRRKA